MAFTRSGVQLPYPPLTYDDTGENCTLHCTLFLTFCTLREKIDPRPVAADRGSTLRTSLSGLLRMEVRDESKKAVVPRVQRHLVRQN